MCGHPGGVDMRVMYRYDQVAQHAASEDFLPRALFACILFFPGRSIDLQLVTNMDYNVSRFGAPAVGGQPWASALRQQENNYWGHARWFVAECMCSISSPHRFAATSCAHGRSWLLWLQVQSSN